MGPRTWPWHCAREQSSEERRTFTRSPNRRKETTHNNANESTRNATPELVMDKCGRTNLANETPETQDKKKRMQKNAVLRRRRGDERDETYERNTLITRASGTNRGRPCIAQVTTRPEQWWLPRKYLKLQVSMLNLWRKRNGVLLRTVFHNAVRRCYKW